MKIATAAFAAIALVGFTTAQPFGRRHVHRHKHFRREQGVDVITVVKTVYPTGAPEIIVFVNQFGTPLSTMTEGMLAELPSIWTAPTQVPPPSSPAAITSSTSTISIAISAITALNSPVISAIPSAVSAVALQVAPDTSSSSPATVAPPPAPEAASTSTSPIPKAAAVPPFAAPHPATSSTSSSPPASSAPPPPPTSGGYGFSYSPYKADGSCKTQDQVGQDFATIGGGYGFVRIYGTDCNQVATVLSAAKAHGLKLFAGIFDLGTLAAEIATIVSAAAGDWSSFDTISIGNELVNSGTAASTVVAAIGTARTLLQKAGYKGRVVTVDTLVASRANPSLCDASDYCAVNSHPYFDGNVLPANSGSFLATQISTLRAVLANKNQEIVITETGWPTQGGTNGVAVPSVANQAAALSSIKAAFAGNQAGVVLFTVFNDLWKTSSPAQFGAEQFWGFLGNAPSG